MSKTHGHLAEDLIAAAAADAAGLPGEAARHLAQCSQCAARVQALERSLLDLGRTAREFCPPPPRFVSLRLGKKEGSWTPGLARRPALAAAAAAILIALITLAPYDAPAPPAPGTSASGLVMAFEEDAFPVEAQYMSMDADLVEMADNILPAAYMNLAGESYMAWDEGLFDILAPSLNPEPLSSAPITKGEMA